MQAEEWLDTQVRREPLAMIGTKLMFLFPLSVKPAIFAGGMPFLETSTAIKLYSMGRMLGEVDRDIGRSQLVILRCLANVQTQAHVKPR